MSKLISASIHVLQHKFLNYIFDRCLVFLNCQYKLRNQQKLKLYSEVT